MMLLVCSLFACFVSCTYGLLGRGDLEKYGPFQLALHSNLIKCEHNRTLKLDVSGINVYFYDFANNQSSTFAVHEAAERILAMKNFDSSKKIIMYVGGFKSQIEQPNQEQIRNTFKNIPNSYLIIPDHSQYTNNEDGEMKSYARSVKYVHHIGKALAQMLAGLHRGGVAGLHRGVVAAQNVHCIGHSLGGQILGQLGEQFLRITGRKLARISALDPAGPCFSDSLLENQVRSGVAEYVEIYHCNSGALGSSSVFGDVDFFLNKRGETQPNCRTPFIPELFESSKAASCNHQMCVDMWTATVRHPEWFTAWKCDSYVNFKNGNCVSNDKTVAGFWNPGKATGIYFLSTEGYDLTA